MIAKITDIAKHDYEVFKKDQTVFSREEEFDEGDLEWWQQYRAGDEDLWTRIELPDGTIHEINK